MSEQESEYLRGFYAGLEVGYKNSWMLYKREIDRMLIHIQRLIKGENK